MDSEKSCNINNCPFDYGSELKYIRRDLDKLINKIDNLDRNYVTKTEWLPVQKIVYGLVAIMLSSLLLGILALVIQKGGGI